MKKTVVSLFIMLNLFIPWAWAQDWEEETPVIRASVDVVNVLCTVREKIKERGGGDVVYIAEEERQRNRCRRARHKRHRIYEARH